MDLLLSHQSRPTQTTQTTQAASSLLYSLIYLLTLSCNLFRLASFQPSIYLAPITNKYTYTQSLCPLSEFEEYLQISPSVSSLRDNLDGSRPTPPPLGLDKAGPTQNLQVHDSSCRAFL
jgi:hypothetical protein